MYRFLRLFCCSPWSSHLLSFVWGDLDGGCCWLRNSVYLRGDGDKAHGPNFVFSSIIHDWYSVNCCSRFDKVSTSYRLFVTTFPDVPHDRDQNSLNTSDQYQLSKFNLTLCWHFCKGRRFNGQPFLLDFTY